ncbi:MAG TPA: hypothetical protein VFO10_02545, partial [Oligoflexus sp.]|uniref:hypothetical protein n=1 Tax=Oligoflexus sp. TaxID=1971216 RepID=UPI002D7F1087
MKMDSLQRILFSSKSMAVVLVILGIGLCFLLLRGQTQRKLNKRLTGASNADGDETRWLKTPWGLFVKPVIGYYRNEMLVDLPTISAYFLADDRYNFILPAPRWLRAFKFRFWLTKTLQPIPR